MVAMEGDYLTRFLSRIVRSSGCWEWNGAHFKAGYAETWDGKRPLYAHRVAYELWVGPIPDGRQIDHLCRNRGCVNPQHLEVVLPAGNNQRGLSPSAENMRKTHCKRGHPFDEANTHITPTGRRDCRACWPIDNAARRAKIRNFRPPRAPGMRTHCPAGHPYDAANTGIQKDGSRRCRACSRERARTRREQQRQR